MVCGKDNGRGHNEEEEQIAIDGNNDEETVVGNGDNEGTARRRSWPGMMTIGVGHGDDEWQYWLLLGVNEHPTINKDKDNKTVVDNNDDDEGTSVVVVCGNDNWPRPWLCCNDSSRVVASHDEDEETVDIGADTYDLLQQGVRAKVRIASFVHKDPS